VQQRVPPMLLHDLRDDDRDKSMRMTALNVVNMLHQGRYKLTKRCPHHFERRRRHTLVMSRPIDLLGPLTPHLRCFILGGVTFEIAQMNRDHVSG